LILLIIILNHYISLKQVILWIYLIYMIMTETFTIISEICATQYLYYDLL